MGYFIFIGLLFIVALVAYLGLSQANTPDDGRGNGFNATPYKWGVVAATVVIAAVVTIFATTDTVQNGHIGIKKQFGSLVGTTGEGLVFHSPVQSVSQVSVQGELRTYDMTGGNSAVSSDSQPVFLTVQVNYSLERAGAVDVYRQTGGHYVERVLDPAVYQDVKEVTAKYKAVEFAKNREQIRQEIAAKLQADVGKIKTKEGSLVAAFKINNVGLKNVDFTDDLKRAIEQTVANQQKAKAAEAQVAIAQAEAQQTIATAEGDAKSVKIAAEATAYKNRVTQRSLTPLLVQQQAIDKLNPEVQVIVCDSGKVCVPQAVIATATAGK